MAMKNVIFNRPVRMGGKIYPKSKRSVEVDEKHLAEPYSQILIDSGAISIPAVAAPAKAAAAAPAPTAKAKA